MMKSTGLILVFLLICGSANAQNDDSYNDVWFFLLNHIDVGEKWEARSELHWRYTNSFDDKLQLVIRPSMSYKINSKVKITAGYSYVRNYPFREGATPIPRPEHNLWEQILLKHSEGKFSLSHRYRVEHRFLGNLAMDSNNNYIVEDYSFTNRFRYRFTVKHPLGNDFSIIVFDELWVRGDNRFRNAQFDRNWIYFGLGRKVLDSGSVSLGYMHQILQRGVGVYEKHPTLLLKVQYDFRK